MESASLVTGGTGFVGQALIARLSNVTITSRSEKSATRKAGTIVDKVIEWSPSTEPLKLPENHRFNSVVNLMGESIAHGRWTDEKKQRLRDSRVIGTRKLVDALIASKQLPDVLVSASAIGIYGDAKEAIVEEDHPLGNGFLTDICSDWESEAMRIADHGVRVVCLRIGIVLGDGGGALEKMTPLFRWGAGGRLGTGKQFMAWIHINDLVSLILWAINAESVSGPLNATAPNPVRNIEFTRELASAVNRPALLPVPRFALRLALGEFAESLFYSQRVVPAKALANGFQFQYTDVGNAIKDIVG